MKRAWLLLLLAACPQKKGPSGNDHPPNGTGAGGDDGGAVALAIDAGPEKIVLPPAPPLPPVPLGLPDPSAAPPSANDVALGELLFFDPRLSSTGKHACASCHDADHGFGSSIARDTTAAGQPDLRHTPALANLRWHKELAWDGRYGDAVEMLRAHAKGQLGADLDVGAAHVAAVPVYVAHFERLGKAPAADSLATALAAYVATRYQGDAPWDRYEHGDKTAASPEAVKGYGVFTGKAQCSTCHVPPLYTDLGYHAVGLIALPDEGRGRVSPTARGAFKTPTVRGAALHPPYFHDGSAATLDAAIDWHLAGGTGQRADRSIIDPALVEIALSPDERAQLGAFVRALSPSAPPPAHKPELPK